MNSLVIEYAENGSILKGEPENFIIIQEEQAKKYFTDVLQGLEYSKFYYPGRYPNHLLVHSQNIIHRDIKPENLLVTADGTAKISDFGVSIILEGLDDERLKRTVGSPAFLAPELCSGKMFFGGT